MNGFRVKRSGVYLETLLFDARRRRRSEEERLLCDRVRRAIVQLRAGGNPFFYQELNLEPQHSDYAVVHNICLQEKVTPAELNAWRVLYEREKVSDLVPAPSQAT